MLLQQSRVREAVSQPLGRSAKRVQGDESSKRFVARLEDPFAFPEGEQARLTLAFS